MDCQLYSAFGLLIRSELDLSPLLSVRSSGRNPPDIIVRRASSEDTFPDECFALLLADDNETRPFIRQAAADIYLLWPDVGAGRISDGREIVVRPLPNVPDDILKLHIVGSSLAVILHQRKFLPLHASVVAINNQAVAFLGEWGAGKSTTAAALLAYGHTLVADDIAAVELVGSHPVVYPGIPWMKLWPESVTALDSEPSKLPLVHPEEEKRRLNVKLDETEEPLPLRCLYILDDGPRLEIQPISRNVALRDLLANWYGSRFGRGFLEESEQITLFKQSANLLAAVPTYRLYRPDELGLLSEMADVITAHALALPTP